MVKKAVGWWANTFTVAAQNMDIIWFAVGVAFACAALLPLRYLRPAHKRIYVPAAIYVSAIVWGAVVVACLDGEEPLLSGAILIGVLANANYVARRIRVCQECGAIVGLKRGAKEIHACNPDDLLVDVDCNEDGLGLIGAPPAGFTVATAANGDLVIDYRTTGMGWFLGFAILWLVAWMAGASFVTYDLLSGKPEDISWSLIFLMWAPILPVGGGVTWYYFSVTTLTLSNDSLVARRRLGPIRRERRLARNELTLLKIVKDGGEGVEGVKDGDTFHSWGLIVRGPKELRILARQPKQQILWLGHLLAKWSGLTLKDAGTPVSMTYETL